MSSPSSLIRYHELYTAITVDSEEKGSNTIFQYSFLEGSIVYSYSHSSLKKISSIFFMCSRNLETIGLAVIFGPDSDRSVCRYCQILLSLVK